MTNWTFFEKYKGLEISRMKVGENSYRYSVEGIIGTIKTLDEARKEIDKLDE